MKKLHMKSKFINKKDLEYNRIIKHSRDGKNSMPPVLPCSSICGFFLPQRWTCPNLFLLPIVWFILYIYIYIYIYTCYYHLPNKIVSFTFIDVPLLSLLFLFHPRNIDLIGDEKMPHLISSHLVVIPTT